MNTRSHKDFVKEKISQVTYCGLYCPNCGARCHIPSKATALKETMIDGQYDEWGHSLEGFTAFWKFLNGLAETDDSKSCRNESCGFPGCGIRKCAKNKGVETCPFCEDYPCEMIRQFSGSEPTLIFDGKRMKEIGLEKWIREQEERRRRGFSYSDIRCGKSSIPGG